VKLTEAMYASSQELRDWCDCNRNRVYIPEWLLNLAIREVASTMLQAAGYKVLPVENTTAAVEVVRTTSERIDLLLTDIMMSSTKYPVSRELVGESGKSGKSNTGHFEWKHLYSVRQTTTNVVSVGRSFASQTRSHSRTVRTRNNSSVRGRASEDYF